MGVGDFVFTALKGQQAGRDYYVIMCPLKLVPKLFMFQAEDLPASLKAQRTLNKSRIPEIANYISNNKNDYIFSSLTVSIDADVKFENLSFEGDSKKQEDIGKLSVPMGSSFLINDGQHRRAAIELALKSSPDIGDETISVVLFIDIGLKKSQQMFADLNKHAVRPTRSIGILYDHRDPLSCLSRDLINEVEVFKNLTEIEKTSISNRSTKLFTLSSIYVSTKQLLKKSKSNNLISESERERAINFWNLVSANMPDWKLAATKKVSTFELRKDYIHSHALFMLVIGKIGALLDESEIESKLSILKTIDWSRSNSSLWEGRAMHNGRISISHNSILLTENIIKRKFGIALNNDELEAEKNYLGKV